jgi:hypothetical protein
VLRLSLKSFRTAPTNSQTGLSLQSGGNTALE